jgi:peptidoglycan/LPS O-acetylase OafA/YrhL
MASAGAEMNYRPDIDGLRAVAVLAVVFYHAGLGFPGGYLGVDIFFVISGYLIVKIIYDPMIAGRFSAPEFYARRIRRLFPAMLVMLLATGLWAAGWLIAPDLEDFGASLIAALLYVPNAYFYVTNSAYFSESALTKPLLHTWSLGVEEQFYVLAPLLLWALVRLTPRRAHVPAIAVVVLLSFGLSAWKPAATSPGGFYLLPARAWELGLGGVLALAAPPIHRHRRLAEALSIAGLAAIMFALVTAWDNIVLGVWHPALAAGGTAAILASGAGPPAFGHRLLGIGPVTFVGRISYSLYLWHWPVFVALTYGAAASLPLGQALLGVAISLALAAASWRWIEQPFRSRRRLPRSGRLFAASALATLAGLAVGAALLAGRGFPARHPELAPLLDGPRLWSPRMECGVLSVRQASAGALCLRGAPGVRPSFVLVGDSHAHSLSSGLFEAASARGAAGTQFVAPGFFPLPGWEAVDPATAAPFTRLFETYLRRHPEIRTVFVAAFWSHAATGRMYRDPLRIDRGGGGEAARTAHRQALLRRSLDSLVRRFPDRLFILLDDVPTGEALSPRQNARQIFARGRPSAGLPRAAADTQRATYEPALRAVAGGNANVRYVPLLAILCGERFCPASDMAGRPIYQDGDHLSAHGAALLAPRLRALFAAPPPRLPSRRPPT